MDHGLAAYQFVYDQIVLDQHHAPKMPASHVRFFLEAQKVHPEIPKPVALDDPLIDLEASAGQFCPDAIIYPGIEFVWIHQGVRDEALQYIRIVQQGDVRGGLEIQAEFVQVFDGCLIGNDGIKGLLPVFKTIPLPLENDIATG